MIHADTMNRFIKSKEHKKNCSFYTNLNLLLEIWRIRMFLEKNLVHIILLFFEVDIKICLVSKDIIQVYFQLKMAEKRDEYRKVKRKYFKSENLNAETQDWFLFWTERKMRAKMQIKITFGDKLRNQLRMKDSVILIWNLLFDSSFNTA